MGLFRNIDKSAKLMQGLAERMEVDLSRQILANAETAGPEYRSMLLNCTGCTDQDACAVLQQENSHLDHAPHYCRNRSKLNRARPK